MGLASWAFHCKSFADFLMFYDSTVIGPATLGISTPIMQSITNIMFRIPGESVFIPLLSALANFGTTALHVINKFYGLAQFGYHTVTAIFSIGTINEMQQQNAPPGTRISELGIASLIAHFASYGPVPLPVPGGTFTKAYNPAKIVPRTAYDAGDKGEMEGYERFAALIRDSRDPFTLECGWKFGLFTLPPNKQVSNDNGGGIIFVDDRGALNFKIGDRWDLGIFGVEWEIRFYFGLNIARDGGSELRLSIPATGVSGKDFNWSSADTTVLGAFAGGGFDIEAFINLFGKEISAFKFGASIDVGDERLVVAVNINGSADGCQDVTDDQGNTTQVCDSKSGSKGIEIINIPFPTSAPFGVAFTEAGTTATNNLRRIKDMRRESLGGTVSDDAYGKAAKRTLAWDSTPPTPPGVAFSSDLDARQKTATQNEARQRFFSRTDASMTPAAADEPLEGALPITANDKSAHWALATRNFSWDDHTGNPIYTGGVGGSESLASSSPTPTLPILGDVLDILVEVVRIVFGAIGDLLGVLGSSVGFDAINQDGYAKSTVHVTTARLPVYATLGTMNQRVQTSAALQQPLEFKASAGVLTDGWNAGGVEQTYNQAGGTVPTVLLKELLNLPGLNEVWAVIGLLAPELRECHPQIPSFLSPDFPNDKGSLWLGHSDIDAVHPDRLGDRSGTHTCDAAGRCDFVYPFERGQRDCIP